MVASELCQWIGRMDGMIRDHSLDERPRRVDLHALDRGVDVDNDKDNKVHEDNENRDATKIG